MRRLTLNLHHSLTCGLVKVGVSGRVLATGLVVTEHGLSHTMVHGPDVIPDMHTWAPLLAQQCSGVSLPVEVHLGYGT